MPRASKVCSKPNCPHLQPCPDHPKIPFEGSTRSQRLPRDWERRRAKVLAQQTICNVCNNALSEEVDHIEPGDDHSYENLQGICVQCHKAKTAKEAAEARSG